VTPKCIRDMTKISQAKKNEVKALLSQKRSIREVAKTVRISKTQVHAIGKQFGIHSKKTAGRPKSLNTHDVTYMVTQLVTQKVKTARSLAHTMSTEKQKPISRFTISRELKNAGLKCTTMKKKPMISEKNRKERLAFAKAHKDWTVADWKRVIFSDETKINRFGSDGRRWTWFRDGESLKRGNVKQTVKGGGGSLMLWGCITCKGVGYLADIEGIMDRHLYQKILEGELVDTIDYYEIDETKMIFQQDNDPKHTAKSVKAYLNEQEFKVLSWPSQSPDLNPIENCWSHLKSKIYSFEKPATGLKELWERIEEEWEKISKDTNDYIEKLYESMPRRMEAVIKAKGLWTDY